MGGWVVVGVESNFSVTFGPNLKTKTFLQLRPKLNKIFNRNPPPPPSMENNIFFKIVLKYLVSLNSTRTLKNKLFSASFKKFGP